MSSNDADEVKDISFTPWDRRVVAAINVVAAARRGSVILRVIAAVVAIVGVVGAALTYFWNDALNGVVSPGTFDGQRWGLFLLASANPLAVAGIVLALSFVVDVAAARLDIDIVLADEDETDSDEVTEP